MDASLTIIRRPVKHARLRVREDTSVQLIIPNCFDQALIDSLLQKKATWIARHQQFFRNRVSDRRTFAADEVLLFDQVFRFVPTPELGREVVVDETAKEIRTGRDFTRKADLHRWQRTHAHNFLSTRIAELSASHRLPFNRLFIRSQRTKWGTCSAKRNVSLNWRLILTPRHVIDYVILHELVHTKILNHSHSFWVHIRAICPNAETAMRWLKESRHPCSSNSLTPEEIKIVEAAATAH
jgi:predicted metal-dependent hydrolase